MFVRLTLSTALAVLATSLILFAMQGLIAHGRQVIVEERKTHCLCFYPTIEDSKVVKAEQPPEREWVKPIDPPPITPAMEYVEETIYVPGPPPAEPKARQYEFGLASGDTPLIAVMRAAPQYPARMNGTEGWVDIMFDVSASGEVFNIAVVASSHSGFERSAIKAAQRFKFKPAVVDGMPIASFGIQYRFRFEMSD